MYYILFVVYYILHIKYFIHYILLLLLQIISDYHLLTYPINTPGYKEEIFLLLQCNVRCYNSIRVIRNFLILTFHSFLISLHLHSRIYSKQEQVNLCRYSNVFTGDFPISALRDIKDIMSADAYPIISKENSFCQFTSLVICISQKGR